MKILKKNKLYIVPTPIGNLEDITYRAINILKKIDIILAENIKHTKILINYFKIKKTILKFNNDYEKKKIKKIIKLIETGKNIALLSNAGTPTINDPGYKLIHACHLSNIKIIPLPGPCAAITALSASGMSSNKFCYEGFLPKKKKSKETLLKSLKKEKKTIIFYESKHRIIKSLKTIITIFGKNRKVLLAKEMTKIWETIHKTTAINLLYLFENKEIKKKGEIVIIINGYKEKKKNISDKIINTFKILNNTISVKKAIDITAKIHKIKKNQLYNFIIKKYQKKDNYKVNQTIAD